MKKTTLEAFLQENPELNSRKYIPFIVERLTGVKPADQIAVKVAIRRLQELIPNDKKGRMLEADWRDKHGMKSQGEFVGEVGALGKLVMVNGVPMLVR